MEKTKTTKFLGSFSLSKNGGAGGTTNYDNLTNKPKVNGIVLSGNKTSADLGITTLTPFPSTWPTTGRFEDLLAAIRVDTIAVKGASFLGEVTFDDLPANLGNAEIKVEILEGTTPATKVIHSVITSGNREPYRWEYTSWNSGNSNSGWISFQLPLTAGNGISIENNVISTTGGADVPEDVYTQSNLLAGNGVEIVNEPVEGGIDEHTLACWHFDEDFRDVISNIILPNGTLTAEHKFGTHGYSFGGPSSTGTVVTLNREKDFTIDFFIQLTSASTNLAWDGYFQGYPAQSLIVVHQDKLYMATTNGSTTSINLPNPLQLNTWNHIAFVYSFENKIISAFVNGNKIGQLATTYPVADFNLNNFNGVTPWYIDELRISDIARPLNPDGKFPVPTQSYSLAVPTGNKVINNTITKTSQLTNDSGFITDVPVATTTVAGKMKADGTTITVTEDGTISAVTSSIDVPSDVYTQSNLLAGKNITIEEVLPEGGIDNHTLACFHCDGNVDDATNNKYITPNNSFTNSEFYNVISPKFGSASLTPGGGGYDRIFTNNTILLSTFTLDFWMKKSRSSIYVTMSLPDNYVFNQDTWKFYKANQPDTILISSISTPDNSNWHHFVFTYEPNKICIFIDGILQGDCKRTSDNFYLGAVNFNGTYDLDEIRFSDIVRPLNPDGKFPVPTQPYSVAESTGKVAINNAITKTSQLTNDSGFLTSVPENLVTSDNVTKIVKLTQAEYDQLETKDDSTFYAIVG